jgi:hypothetical protein
MIAVVRHVHCFEGAFVFGGYVRDLVINRILPRDIDMCFRTLEDARSFIRILSLSYGVHDVLRKSGYSWGLTPFDSLTARVHACGVDGREVSFNIDLACGARESIIGSDFTCNLLMMSRGGMQLTGIPHSFEYHPSPLLEILSSVSARTFSMVGGSVSLLPKEVGPYIAKLCNRSAKMISRGWRLQMSKTTFNTNQYSVLSEDWGSCSTECAVCKTDFEAVDVCTRTLCNHVFHTPCITEWLIQGRSEITCPVCRELHFMVRPDSIRTIPIVPPIPADDEDDDDDDDDEILLDDDTSESESELDDLPAPRRRRMH